MLSSSTAARGWRKVLCDGAEWEGCSALSGIMVLLVKQVHLQKEVAADESKWELVGLLEECRGGADTYRLRRRDC